jgi:hypothetical protein
LPIPDVILPPEPPPTVDEARSALVIEVCNRYLQAILSKDQARIEAAARDWDAL